MTNFDLGPLSPYEREEWHRIQRWREDQARRRFQLPAPVRELLDDARDRAIQTWDAIPGTDLVEDVISRILMAGQQAVADAVALSLQRDRILDAARATGANVDNLADLQSLDLAVIDSILPSLSLQYSALSAATGAGSGFVAGGGTAAIVGTGGAGAAPGAAAVGGALAADVVATIAFAARVVTHYAGYYGYDTRQEDEKAVLLTIIGAGMAAEGAAKQKALLHVRQVAMMVARRATWKELGEEAVVKLVQRIFTRLSTRLTKQKLGQALPLAGMAVGAGLNYALMRKVGTAASFLYRERFLIDKYQLDAGEPMPDLGEIIDINYTDDDGDLPQTGAQPD